MVIGWTLHLLATLLQRANRVIVGCKGGVSAQNGAV
jgi:hypothetical protein